MLTELDQTCHIKTDTLIVNIGLMLVFPANCELWEFQH